MDAKEDSEEKGAKPKTWWQWLFMYPMLAVTIVSAVPTFLKAYQSYKYDVPYGKVDEAQAQQALWIANADCLSHAVFTPTTNPNGVEIASVVCSSGDVLLRGKRPGWQQPQMRWVSWSDVATDPVAVKATVQHSSTHTGFDKSAVRYAALTNDNQFNPSYFRKVQMSSVVLCRPWFPQPGLMIQRIATNMGCFDQWINTYNGMVIQQRPAPCGC